MRTYAGIDPGFRGAVAVLAPDDTVEFFDPPVIQVPLKTKSKKGNVRFRSEYVFSAAADILRGLIPRQVALVVVEKVVAMPDLAGRKMPAASAMASGVGYGMWQMGLGMLGIPYQIVAPASWKGALLRDQAKTKEAAVAFAARLYPGAASRLYGARGGILDGRAEALLLAHFGRVMGSFGIPTET